MLPVDALREKGFRGGDRNVTGVPESWFFQLKIRNWLLEHCMPVEPE